jgi:hypothetical protein
MNKIVFTVLAVSLAAGGAQAGNVGWNVNVSVGSGHPAPAPVMVPIIVEAPPLFLLPAPLGFQVAVGVPYHMYRIDNRFYLFHNHGWYVGSHYAGPWFVTSYDRLPHGLRKHRHATIVDYRDAEYRRYENRKNYSGKSNRPEKRSGNKGRGDNGWGKKGKD